MVELKTIALTTMVVMIACVVFIAVGFYQIGYLDAIDDAKKDEIKPGKRYEASRVNKKS